MGRKSSIKALPAPVRAAVDEALKRGATIDEVVAACAGLGADVSRSAVGRYRQDVMKIAERVERSREISRIFVERLGAAPEGKQGRLLIELMQTVVFDFLVPAGDGQAPALDPEEIMFLGRAMKDLASAEKTSADRELKIRQGLAQEAAQAMEDAVAATGAGVSADTMAEFKARFLGVIK